MDGNRLRMEPVRCDHGHGDELGFGQRWLAYLVGGIAGIAIAGAVLALLGFLTL